MTQYQSRRRSVNLVATLSPPTAAVTMTDPRRFQSANEPLTATQELLASLYASLPPHVSDTDSDSELGS